MIPHFAAGRWPLLLAALLAVAFSLAACGDDDDAGAEGRITVVTSTTILADFARQVGGDRVDVRAIIPEEAEVHTYTLTPGAVRIVASADLVIIAGADLASVEDDIRDNARGQVIVLTEGMPLKPFPPGLMHDDEDDHTDEEDDHDHGAADPHFWMDIDLVVIAVEKIRDALIEADPNGADVYRERTGAFIAELHALDDEIQTLMDTLPDERRYLVTFHDAFGYFADRYGLTILGFVVEGPEEEPSAATIAELIREMRERDIRYVYKEPQFSTRVIEQLASDTGAQVRSIPSGSLSSEYPSYREFMLAIAHGIAD